MGTPVRSQSLSTSSDRYHQDLHNPFTALAARSPIQNHALGKGLTRRGHSDGDLLSGTVGPDGRHRGHAAQHSPPSAENMGGSLGGPDVRQGSYDMAARRRAVFLEDRRRHFSEHREGSDRRSPSGFLFPPRMGARSRHGATQSSRDHTFPGLLRDAAGQPSVNRVDRSLPPHPPSADGSSGGHTRNSELPRWQPDDEISHCPICGTAFTFWYRKHHCRKCGRVVCASCSPHRITIPRQFIVHPPINDTSTHDGQKQRSTTVIDLTGDDTSEPSPNGRPQSSDYRIDSALGGGQEVRLCNPCVPDPNPLPHIPQQSADSWLFGSQLRVRFRDDPNGPGNNRRHSSNMPPPVSTTRSSFGLLQRYRPTDVNASLPPLPSVSGHRHSHSARMQEGNAPPHSLSTVFGSAPDRPEQLYLAGLLQRHRPSFQHHRHQASLGLNTTTPRQFQGPMSLSHNAAQISPAPPQLMEEDECPICHGALPPKGPDGSEAAREQHVTACVETHFSSSTARSSHPMPASATDAAVAASAATPSQASGRQAFHRSSAASEAAQPSASFQQRRRTTGMVVYNATEKDCVGEDGGGEAECVICFEEFAVGDEMGRLECLCKFHRKCVRQWWDTKGTGLCPVHQQGN